ncbi:MAG: Arylsulfatase [candidate division BRC1 bacterium ADurb.BinA364]|nr:MAG: Arylsulfatase [candidate division BRC1 bacterium ADurb.BinA364]
MGLRPNILLITSDQQHFSTLGSVNPKIRTPALDRLAREGTRFDRAYCNNPVCSPSRSTIITGLYPAWHHCWTIGVKLPEDVPTVGGIFQRHGYATTLVGKGHFQPLASEPDQVSIESRPALWDMEFWRRFHGPWYGFERIELTRGHTDESDVGQHYPIWLEEQGLANWRDYFERRDEAGNRIRQTHSWTLPERFHYTTWTAERAIANMERHAGEGRPFFLWASFHDPHPSYLVSEPWASMYRPEEMEPGALDPDELQYSTPPHRKTQEAKPDFSEFKETPHMNFGYHSHRFDRQAFQKNMAVYYGMVSFMDSQIGRILDSLERLGLADNTLVVFTSDHGHFLGQHGLIAKGPFHYEDMIRVPMIARWPGRIPAGQASRSLQALVDYAPTFLDAADIAIPGMMQGASQLEAWQNPQVSARDHVIVENRHQPSAVHLRTYLDERYKLTVYRGRPYGELYDLQEDPGETHNRWDDPDYARIKSELFRNFLDAELRREPTRYKRIAFA